MAATKKAVVKKSSKKVVSEPMHVASPSAMSCSRCEHIPVGVNAIMSMLIALVFTLSALVIAAAMTIHSQAFQLNAFNQSGHASDVVARR
jgi:hypothetical protein